jgi:AcrR family transcriptional regulator
MQDHPRTKDPTVAGPGRPRSPRADKAILRAALKLFIERGIDGVGIEQVAASAGVARTTVYRRWSSRDALIAAAIADGRGAADERTLSQQLPPPMTLKEVIRALAETLAAPDYLKIIARLAGSIPDHPELMSTYWHSYLAPRRNIAAKLLEDARAEGLIRQDADAEILLDLIGGAVMYYLLVRQGERSKGRLHAYLIKVFRELGLANADGRIERGR